MSHTQIQDFDNLAFSNILLHLHVRIVVQASAQDREHLPAGCMYLGQWGSDPF